MSCAGARSSWDRARRISEVVWTWLFHPYGLVSLHAAGKRDRQQHREHGLPPALPDREVGEHRDEESTREAECHERRGVAGAEAALEAEQERGEGRQGRGQAERPHVVE